MRGPSDTFSIVDLLSIKLMSASYHHNKRFSRKRRNSRELEKYEKQRLPTLESSPSSPWRVGELSPQNDLLQGKIDMFC